MNPLVTGLVVVICGVPLMAHAESLEILSTQSPGDWYDGQNYDYSGLGLFHETTQYGFFADELTKMKIVDAQQQPKNFYDPDSGQLYVEFELYQNTSAPNPDAPPDYTPFDEFVASGRAFTTDPIKASEMPGHPDFVDPGVNANIAGTLQVELDFSDWDAGSWPDLNDFLGNNGPNGRTTVVGDLLTTTIDVFGYDYGGDGGGFNTWSENSDGSGTLYIWAANGTPKSNGYKGKYESYSSDFGIDFKLTTGPPTPDTPGSVVPEPSSMALLALGGFPLLLARRRRRENENELS